MPLVSQPSFPSFTRPGCSTARRPAGFLLDVVETIGAAPSLRPSRRVAPDPGQHLHSYPLEGSANAKAPGPIASECAIFPKIERRCPIGVRPDDQGGSGVLETDVGAELIDKLGYNA